MGISRATQKIHTYKYRGISMGNSRFLNHSNLKGQHVTLEFVDRKCVGVI